MAKLPLVAIIGRPNTGKSTLFNKLVGRRIAIESEVPGTTRDHIVRKVESDAVDYLMLDTGGMGGGTKDKDFEKDVHAQSLIALESADLILFTVDGKSELLSSDRTIVDLLRRKRRRHVPVILVVTKCDTEKVRTAAEHAFHDLGVADEIILTSPAHNLGTEELREMILKHLKKLHFGKESTRIPNSEFRIPHIAIVGKPNVGKSSFINALMSEPQRAVSPKLVSPIPGTTRDATDTVIRNEGKEYVFVDTAGLRRKARIEEDLEGLSVLRAIQAIEDADLTLLLLEATETVSNQDKKIAGSVIERGKGLIILINKIDLLKGEERREKMLETQASFPFCRFAPVIPVSTKTREGILKVFPLIDTAYENLHRRIGSKDLHRFLADAIHGQPVGELKTAKHITQAKDLPPTFVLFVRHPKKVQVTQLRYLENRLRSIFAFGGVPVRWVTKTGGGRRAASDE